MQPSRPVGNDAKARFEQWAFDVLIAETPMGGPGVLASVSMRGVFHEITARARGRVGDEGTDSGGLPTLIPESLQPRYHWGYWFDEEGELKFWNTELFESGGQQYARRTEIFVNNVNPPSFSPTEYAAIHAPEAGAGEYFPNALQPGGFPPTVSFDGPGSIYDLRIVIGSHRNKAYLYASLTVSLRTDYFPAGDIAPHSAPPGFPLFGGGVSP